jgi:hypothetical protein
MGGLALAMLAESRPDLVEQAVAAFSGDIARTVSNYNRNFTGPAEALIRVVIEYAPRAWATVLNNIDPTEAEANLAECLRQDEDHRRTAAALIESAIAVPGPVGDMARRLRTRFPIASVPSTSTPHFRGKRHRPRRKRTG